MFEIFDLIAVLRRARKERQPLLESVEQSGGRVLEYRRISRLVPSPFSGYRIFPVLHEIVVQYDDRRGRWYIRTSADSQAANWAWSDDFGYSTLPTKKIDAAIANDVRAIGFWADGILVGGIILIGVVVCVGVVLALT